MISSYLVLPLSVPTAWSIIHGTCLAYLFNYILYEDMTKLDDDDNDVDDDDNDDVDDYFYSIGDSLIK